MQSDQRRKRKRLLLRPPFSSFYYCFRCSALLLFFAFFLFFNGFFFNPLLTLFRSTSRFLSPLTVEDTVLFPDHVLLLLSSSSRLNLVGGLDCVYRPLGESSSLLNRSLETKDLSNASSDWRSIEIGKRRVLSLGDYTELQSIARCPLPPRNYSALVGLRRGKGMRNFELLVLDERLHSWETLVYAAVLDGKTAVVFVKGLNLRPGRVSDPAQFSCYFNWEDDGENFAATTHSVTAAQEIVRCLLPVSLQSNPSKSIGVRVTIGITSRPALRTIIRGRQRGRAASFHPPLPSVAKLVHSSVVPYKKQYELCVCTMLWNQAASLSEWILYHAWLGVERWFIYDNNSDDDIQKVIEELQKENYNVTRHIWPWIKSQEAGFSHCILKARNECKWVAFMDVDEFFYFPVPTSRAARTSDVMLPGRSSLRALVSKYSHSKTIREIRTVCHSFGPSGLTSPPTQGVTVGYTCRLQSPERHKSIVQPDALDDTLLNVVHHFHLKRGYKYLNLPQNIAVINHYKYQVWQVFRSKFFRRVATYVTDWQENQNEGSKDRAPGLGTEPIEPPNWRLQFCEVWDTGLRDFVVANIADPISEMLPWEKSPVA